MARRSISPSEEGARGEAMFMHGDSRVLIVKLRARPPTCCRLASESWCRRESLDLSSTSTVRTRLYCLQGEEGIA